MISLLQFHSNPGLLLWSRKPKEITRVLLTSLIEAPQPGITDSSGQLLPQVSMWHCKPSDSAGVSLQKSSKEGSLRCFQIADCDFVLLIQPDLSLRRPCRYRSVPGGSWITGDFSDCRLLMWELNAFLRRLAKRRGKSYWISIKWIGCLIPNKCQLLQFSAPLGFNKNFILILKPAREKYPRQHNQCMLCHLLYCCNIVFLLK